jgi:hypothetical protein
MADPDRHEGSFRTHANYLAAFGMLCRVPYTGSGLAFSPRWGDDLRALRNAVGASPSLQPPAGAPGPDISQLRASLQNAWGTELLLALGGEVATEEELLRLVNNWAVVQAYYVIYHATQALIVARGAPRPESHPKTQRQFVAAWVDRPLDLPPWTLGATDGGWRNGPRAIDDSLSSWSTCTTGTCWALAAKALRTTREEHVSDALRRERESKRRAARREWRETETTRLAKGRRPRKVPNFSLPRLTAAEKRTVAGKVRSHSIVDYLYRLRLKTNYEDAAMFTDGPTDNVTSRKVHTELCFIASSTMLVHELHIAQVIGAKRLGQWADRWLAQNQVAGQLGLARRQGLLPSA